MTGLTHLWSPAADEGAVRAAAGAWRALAVRVECAAPDLAATATLVTGANEGRSIDAFAQHWEGLVGPGMSDLAALAGLCRTIAEALDAYADELVRVRDELEEIAAEIALTLAVGAAVTWATAGVSAAAAGATVSALTVQAAALGATLATRATAIVRLVGIHASVRAIEGMVTHAVVEPVVAARFRDNEDPLRAVTVSGTAWAGLTSAILPGWKAPQLDKAHQARAVLPVWRDLARTARTLRGVALDVSIELPVAEVERWLQGDAPGPAPVGDDVPVRERAGR